MVRIIEESSMFSRNWKNSYIYLDGNYLRILKRDIQPKELARPVSLENFWDDIFLQVFFVTCYYFPHMT